MLTLSNATKLLGSRALFSEASFQANPGDRIGLVGPNGSGKTTLFRIVNSEESLDEGEVGLPAKQTEHSRAVVSTTPKESERLDGGTCQDMGSQ